MAMLRKFKAIVGYMQSFEVCSCRPTVFVLHIHRYEDLKSIIFEFERQRVQAINHGSDIESSVDNNRQSIAIQQEQDEQVFETALDAQLDKVITFFSQVFSDVESQMSELEAKLEACPEDPYPDGGIRGVDDHGLATLDDQEEYTQKTGTVHAEEHRLSRQSQEKLAVPEATSGPRHKASFESRLSTQTTRESELYVEHLAGLRAQLVQLYVLVSDVESYIDLNRRAFAKILKKHDKVLGRRLKDRYLPRVVAAVPFTPETAAQLHRHLMRVEQIYADLFCGGQTSKAVRQMKTHLRDQLTYERNTVWKDMVHQERQQHGAQYKQDDTKMYRLLPCLAVPAKRVHSAACLLFGVVVFTILMNVPIFAQLQESRCFALLILAAILWATEALPLYATSLLIPFLIVPLGIMRETDGTPMSAHDAAQAVFSSMFSGTIMMLLGGFALAGALSKYGIAKAFASHVLSHAGTRPRWVLLSTMVVAAFLSMWISNVATPVLCFSLIDPVLRTLEHDSPVAPCLLLGIALASCIGGMISPISSPQNIITLQYMQPNPGWGAWFAVAMPISILSILICWCLLLIVYRPDRACQHLNSIKPVKGRITSQQIFVMVITILTIILWCIESSIEHAIGSPGVIAAIPLFVFFGTGLLGKDDLHAFLWSVVVS